MEAFDILIDPKLRVYGETQVFILYPREQTVNYKKHLIILSIILTSLSLWSFLYKTTVLQLPLLSGDLAHSGMSKPRENFTLNTK